MESLHRFSLRLLPLSASHYRSRSFPSPKTIRKVTPRIHDPCRNLSFNLLTTRSAQSYNASSSSSYRVSSIARAGWLLGLGGEGKRKADLPEIVKAGDPVLHEPAQEVDPAEIGSERIQKIIDDMVFVMRRAPGVGLAAPQIGIPLRVS